MEYSNKETNKIVNEKYKEGNYDSRTTLSTKQGNTFFETFSNFMNNSNYPSTAPNYFQQTINQTFNINTQDSSLLQNLFNFNTPDSNSNRTQIQAQIKEEKEGYQPPEKEKLEEKISKKSNEKAENKIISNNNPNLDLKLKEKEDEKEEKITSNLNSKAELNFENENLQQNSSRKTINDFVHFLKEINQTKLTNNIISNSNPTPSTPEKEENNKKNSFEITKEDALLNVVGKENKTGRWILTEHFKFLMGILLYGKNWNKIQQFIKTRSSTQIRSHAQKFLIKLERKYGVQSKHNIM